MRAYKPYFELIGSSGGGKEYLGAGKVDLEHLSRMIFFTPPPVKRRDKTSSFPAGQILQRPLL